MGGGAGRSTRLVCWVVFGGGCVSQPVLDKGGGIGGCTGFDPTVAAVSLVASAMVAAVSCSVSFSDSGPLVAGRKRVWPILAGFADTGCHDAPSGSDGLYSSLKLLKSG